MTSPALRQPRYQRGDLVVLDGKRLRVVEQAWPAHEPPAPGDDDGRHGNVSRWPSYTLKPAGQDVPWVNAAWEGRLSPAPAAQLPVSLEVEAAESDSTEDEA